MEKYRNFESTKSKVFNTTVEIRKKAMEALRAYCDKLDGEKHGRLERNLRIQEITEIAKMISKKDELMRTLKYTDTKNQKEKGLINSVKVSREDAIAIIKKMKDEIVAEQYDKVEFVIVEKELDEMKAMIKNKDLLVCSHVKDVIKENKMNKRTIEELNRRFDLSQ